MVWNHFEIIALPKKSHILQVSLEGYLFLGMIKQLLDAGVTDIKFNESLQVIPNSGKPSSDNTCLVWINFDTAIALSNNCLLLDY